MARPPAPRPPAVAVVAVGNVREGVSGGFIYTHDVYRALRHAFAGRAASAAAATGVAAAAEGAEGAEAGAARPVVLWQLDTWHRLFGNDAHRHGQHLDTRGVGPGHLMGPAALRRAYAALPAGSVVVLDGFALLQAADVCLSRPTFRRDLVHVGFVQYPFSVEPDASDTDRQTCRVQEARALAKLDLLVGASACSLRMFRECFPKLMARPSMALDVNPPIARFRECFLKHSTRGRIGADDAPSSPPVVVELVAVSNFVPRKNLLLLLEALQECHRRPPATTRPWRLTILANDQESPYRSQCRDFVKAHGLPVRFLGELRDPAAVAQVMLEAHVFVHAADVENYCMAASEAVCCGLAVCATDVGEIRRFSSGAGSKLYPPGDREGLVAILMSLLDARADILPRACARAEAFAGEISRGMHDDLFNSFGSFATRWSRAVDDTLILRARRYSQATSENGPDPRSVRRSHRWYLGLSLAALPCVLLDCRVAASRIWLLFALSSFVDMYIFRRSGILRLSPYIVHHLARLWLYWMLLEHCTRSEAGFQAAVNFNVYNLFLSVSVLLFGLGGGGDNGSRGSSGGGRHPWWWRHVDLGLYLAFIPQRVWMYSHEPQFVTSNFGIGVGMLAVEAGNTLNKILFWRSRGRGS